MERRKFLAGAAGAVGATALTGTPAEAAPATPAQPQAFGRPGKNFPKVGGDLGNTNHSNLGRITKLYV